MQVLLATKLTLLALRNSYKDKAALIEHGSSEMFKEFQKTLVKEDLVRGPPTLKFVSEVGGFASRL